MTAEVQVLVVGGGINGAGIAREAAYQGFSTLLVEQGDFAQATSSQSSKLIHGGIRYLEQGRLKLVFESLHERKRLLKIAPHLVRPLRFHIPVYQGDSRPAWLVGLGCRLYDLLAGSKNLEPSRRLSKAEIDEMSELNPEGLKAVFAYSDAQVFDARLTLETAMSAFDAGAQVKNWTEFIGVEEQGDRFVVTLEDKRTGERYEVKTQVLVNAAGAWTPRLDQKISHKANRPGLKLSRGIHFLVPRKKVTHGFLTLPQGGRVVFVLPWESHLLIGTTESEYRGEDYLSIPASETEKEYLLGVFHQFFPNQPLETQDILHCYSGVRPLIDMGEAELGQMSREYRIENETMEGGMGYWAVFGGKITSYRLLGERLVGQIKERFVPEGKGGRQTASEPLPGAYEFPDDQGLKTKIPTSLLKQWQERYGAGWAWIGQRYLVGPQTALFRKFYPAELDYLVEREWAYTLDDILLRRTLLSFDLSEPEKTILGQALDLKTGRR